MSAVLDFLYGVFKKKDALSNISLVTHYIDSIVSMVEEEYLNDPNMRNAAIESVIMILQRYKVPEISTK